MQEKKKFKKKNLGSYPYASVVFSITLALFVIGLFGLLVLHTTRLSDLIKENIEVQVYLNKLVTESERMKIQKTLSAKDYVYIKEEKPQILFISKDEAAQRFIKETGEDFLNFLGENPLRDTYVVKIKPEYHDKDKMAGIKSDLEKIGGVYEVTYMENLVTAINENLAKISLILVGFAVILLVTVVILINNTIKLALFSQRFLIRSMQLVGATGRFIQNPFLMRATMHGLLGGVFASLLLFLLLRYANTRIEDLVLLQENDKIAILFASLLFIGGVIGFLSTYRAISKYLKMSLDELY